MLRLQPSELGLTPDDVDETFRRMALRQTSRAQQHWTMPPATQTGPSGRPNRPILRRGPQRLIRHALTINTIPIQQPQQAVVTCVDEDDDDDDNNNDDDESHQEAAQPPDRSHQRDGATVGLPAALPSHSMQLPLRLRSHVQARDAQTISHGQAQGSTPLDPRNHDARSERSTPTRSVESGSEQRGQLPLVDASANTPGLRGGGLACVARPQMLTHDTVYTPLASPLNHIQKLSCRSGVKPASLGCASGVAQDSNARSPLHQTQGLTLPTQHASLGDRTKPPSSPGCTHAITESRARHGRGSSSACSEDGDGTSARHLSSTVERLGQSDQTSLRRREGGSGATNASAAYSWYGSLGSDGHLAGSENSPDDECCPQLDGARTGGRRLCPLPSLPYTGMQNDYTASSPPSAHSRQLSRDDVAATTAVGHGVESPLGGHVEQYQGRQHSPYTLLNFGTYANPTIASVGGVPIHGPSRDQDVPGGNSVGLGPGAGDGACRQQSLLEHGTYGLRNISGVGESRRLEQGSSEDDAVSVPVQQRHGVRHGRVQMQRAMYEGLQNAAHPTQAGAARGVGMASSHASAARRNAPHDVSNQCRHAMALGGEGFDSGSSMGLHQARRASPGQTDDTVDADASRPLPSQTWGQHRAEPTRQASPRVYGRGSGRRRGQRRPEGPLNTLASFEAGSSDTWRRQYWQSPPTATTQRNGRVRGQQVDQENAPEEDLMRREEAHVMSRYGEQQQQRTTMHQTPPRIGRVERRMME